MATMHLIKVQSSLLFIKKKKKKESFGIASYTPEEDKNNEMRGHLRKARKARKAQTSFSHRLLFHYDFYTINTNS